MLETIKRVFVVVFCALMLWIFVSYVDVLHNQLGGTCHGWNFFKLTIEATADL